METSDVTVCIPTRGNVDMREILDSLIFPNVIVYDNSVRENHRTYSRYLAAREAETPLVYFQDDDAIISREAQQRLLEAWKPEFLAANMPVGHHRYPGLAWIGWGAVCERELPERAHARWEQRYPVNTRWFELVGCDIAFSLLSPKVTLDLGRTDLPYAYGDDRAFAEPGFERAKDRLYAQALELL